MGKVGQDTGWLRIVHRYDDPALRQNQLPDADALRQAVIAQDAAGVPELGDEGGDGFAMRESSLVGYAARAWAKIVWQS